MADLRPAIGAHASLDDLNTDVLTATHHLPSASSCHPAMIGFLLSPIVPCAPSFGAVSASHCYESATAAPLDCTPLERLQREARERLEASDLIVQGDLVGVLGDRS